MAVDYLYLTKKTGGGFSHAEICKFPRLKCFLLRKILQIVQILVSAEGLLVDLKMP